MATAIGIVSDGVISPTEGHTSEFAVFTGLPYSLLRVEQTDPLVIEVANAANPRLVAPTVSD